MRSTPIAFSSAAVRTVRSGSGHGPGRDGARRGPADPDRRSVAEARAFEPPPTINGSPFQRAAIASRIAILGVGAIQISVMHVEVSGTAGRAAQAGRRPARMTYVLAAIVVPVSLYIILSDDPGDGVASAPPTDVPALWGDPIAHVLPDRRAKPPRPRATSSSPRRREGSVGPSTCRTASRRCRSFETAAACYRSGEARAKLAERRRPPARSCETTSERTTARTACGSSTRSRP